jgi:hypothetical protein
VSTALPEVGLTTDGRLVVAGVFRFCETYGVPLDVVLDLLRQQRIVPCWMSYFREARLAGMATDRILARIDPAVCDVHGARHRDHVMQMLGALLARGSL